MDKPTRWDKLVKSLRFNHIPFTFIRRAKIVTKNKVEYVGNSSEEIQEIIHKINKSEDSDLIDSMKIETKNRKLKREVAIWVDALFEKVFQTKPK